eukprot:6000070-Amphidinium_carterae.1
MNRSGKRVEDRNDAHCEPSGGQGGPVHTIKLQYPMFLSLKLSSGLSRFASLEGCSPTRPCKSQRRSVQSLHLARKRAHGICLAARSESST